MVVCVVQKIFVLEEVDGLWVYVVFYKEFIEGFQVVLGCDEVQFLFVFYIVYVRVGEI